MPISDLASITEDDVYFEFAKAEMPRRPFDVPTPSHLAAKLAQDEALRPDERAEAIAFMRRVRQHMQELNQSHPPKWFMGKLPLAEVGEILVDVWWLNRALREDWPPPFPRTVREFAENPAAQELSFSDPFDFAKVKGAVILVGEVVDGPWVISEGSNRLRGMWRSRSDCDAPQTIDVVVGVHKDALSKWLGRDILLARAAAMGHK